MKIKRYTPGTGSYAPRRTEAEWEQHHHLLSRLHEQHYTRRQMLNSLKTCNFEVTSGQLLAQMKKWDLRVYGPSVRSTSAKSTDSSDCIDTGETGEAQEYATKLSFSKVDPGRELEDYEDAGRIGGLRLVQSEPDPTVDDNTYTDESLPLTKALTTPKVESSSPTLESNENETCETFTQSTGDIKNSSYRLDHSIAEASSIIAQLSTVTEAWCDPFPTTCCCHDLFSGKGKFAKSPQLYNIMLEQSSPDSLRYALMLLNLVDCQSHDTDNSRLQKLVWSALEYYLKLSTRPTYKNSLASYILHNLLRAWESVSNTRSLSPAGMFSSNRSNSRGRLMDRILKMKLSNTNTTLTDPRSHDFDWQKACEQDISTVIGFTARQPSTFPLMNWSGQAFGTATPWLTPNSTQQQQQPSVDLIATAEALTTYMSQQWSRTQSSHTPPGTETKTQFIPDLGDCDLKRVFTALGLMVALELSSYATDLMPTTHTPTGATLRVTNPDAWPHELKHFIDTTVHTLSLNSEHAEKFRKSYWLACEARIGGPGGGGKGIHLGPCTAAHEWHALNRSITSYDEERTWIERRLFGGGSSWPQQPDDLIAPMSVPNTDADTLSMRSVSSLNSFRRFQALALHLKIGTPHARSVRTKSTKSKMSLDTMESHLSWRLERLLEIHDGDDDEEKGEGGGIDRRAGDVKVAEERECAVVEATLSLQERAEQDQLAFEKIEGVVSNAARSPAEGDL